MWMEGVLTFIFSLCASGFEMMRQEFVLSSFIMGLFFSFIYVTDPGKFQYLQIYITYIFENKVTSLHLQLPHISPQCLIRLSL